MAVGFGVTVINAGAIHLLLDAAVFEKIGLQAIAGSTGKCKISDLFEELGFRV